jgi:hypothetical protein
MLGNYQVAAHLVASRVVLSATEFVSSLRLILPAVLYACQTGSLALREDHRLRVFGNSMLRRIFRPKMNEVTGGRRTLHNEELRELYSFPSIVEL